MADREIDAILRKHLAKRKVPGAGTKITEDDPRFNPATMGNKRWGKGYRGALNYSKGNGRGDSKIPPSSDPRRSYQQFVGVGGKQASAPAGSGPLNPLRPKSKYYLGKGAAKYSKGSGRPD